VSAALDDLLGQITACRVCADALPHPPRPVVRVGPRTKILVVGQAPGRIVHETGLPFNDRSGDRLRDWMNVDRDTFYDLERVGVAAMGFCFPGTVDGADLPPRRECAPLWRPRLLPLLTDVRLTLLVGGYAQRWHLGARASTLTDTVQAWRTFPENVMPLPHPSWRNTAWLRRHPWFKDEVLPELRRRVCSALA
jgi:uracil-DNA glycosylase